MLGFMEEGVAGESGEGVGVEEDREGVGRGGEGRMVNCGGGGTEGGGGLEGFGELVALFGLHDELSVGGDSVGRLGGVGERPDSEGHGAVPWQYEIDELGRKQDGEVREQGVLEVLGVGLHSLPVRDGDGGEVHGGLNGKDEGRDGHIVHPRVLWS